MKSSRFQYEYRESASKLHKKVGEALRSGIFSKYKVYQEYPVDKINDSYRNSSHKFDWVILDLFLVIEAHGMQHYKKVNFGGMSDEQAEERFVSQRHRDNVKMDAAIEAGFTYIVVPYSDIKIVDSSYILNLYKKCLNTTTVYNKKEKKETEYAIKQKEKARDCRKQQYQRQKEWLRRQKENEKEGH